LRGRGAPLLSPPQRLRRPPVAAAAGRAYTPPDLGGCTPAVRCPTGCRPDKATTPACRARISCRGCRRWGRVAGRPPCTRPALRPERGHRTRPARASRTPRPRRSSGVRGSKTAAPVYRPDTGNRQCSPPRPVCALLPHTGRQLHRLPPATPPAQPLRPPPPPAPPLLGPADYTAPALASHRSWSRGSNAAPPHRPAGPARRSRTGSTGGSFRARRSTPPPHTAAPRCSAPGLCCVWLSWAV